MEARGLKVIMRKNESTDQWVREKEVWRKEGGGPVLPVEKM